MPEGVIQVPFVGGIDQKSAAEYADPAANLLSVINGLFRHDGGVEKRWGLTALSSAVVQFGPTMGSPIAAFTRQNALLATDGEGLYAYAPSMTAWTSVAGNASTQFVTPALGQVDGLLPPCGATRAPISPSFGGISFPIGGAVSISEGSGVRLVTGWTSALGTSACLMDIATGAPLGIGGVLGGGPNTFNLTGYILNGYAYLFWSDNAGHIYGQSVNLTTGAQNTQALVNDAANPVFDVAAYTGTGTASVLLVYNQTGVGGKLLIKRFETLPSFTPTSGFYTPFRSGGGAGDGPASVISARVDVALGLAYIAYELQTPGPSNYALVLAYNVPAWTQVSINASTNPFQPTIPQYTQGGVQAAGMLSIEPLNATQWWIQAFFGVSGGPYPAQAVYTSSSGAQQSQMTYPYCFTAGRPFRAAQGGVTRLYVPMCAFEQITSIGTPLFQFASVLLFDTKAYEATNTAPANAVWPRVVATLAPRQAAQPYYAVTANGNGGNVWRPSMGTGVGNPTAGTYRYALAVNATEELTGGYLPWLATYTFPAPYSYEEGAGETFIGAGVPSFYDGGGVRELSFHMWPSRCSGVQSTGGSMQISSTYGFAIVFAEPDANGLLHRSAPYTFTVTTDGTHNAAQLSLQGIAYTQRTGAIIEVYRTQANLSTYYFDQSRTAFAAGGIAGAITINSTQADATLASNATLYTTGGVVASVAPPSFRDTCRHVERIWGIDDTGLVIWYSTPFSPSDAPWFNDGLTLQFTDETLVAIDSMDDKLIAYSMEHIWYVEGQGPNNLGLGSDLTVAVLIPSEVGCVNPQSLVPFPGGHIFQAPNGGFYMLDRGLQVTFVGREVQDLTATATVLSASLVPGTHDIRFILSSGVVVTFDYLEGRWATSSYPNTGTPLSAIVDNAQRWTVCSSDGHVYQEKGASSSFPYMDTTADGVSHWVTMSLTTAHVKLGGSLQSFAQLVRVQGYGRWLDPADTLVTLTYDYGRSSQGPKTYTYANLHGSNAEAAVWRQGPQASSSMCSAVQVTISDAAPTGGSATTGQGVLWLGVAFDAVPLGILNPNLAPTAVG